MALAIFAMARRGVLSSRRLLDLGLVFQVAGVVTIRIRKRLRASLEPQALDPRRAPRVPA